MDVAAGVIRGVEAELQRLRAENELFRESLTKIAQLSSTQYYPAPLEDRMHMIYEIAAATDTPE